jgi:hypothetical protein
MRDEALHEIVIEEEAVLATNNEADFADLYRKVDLHTGLLILPQTDSREAQWPLFDAALDYIEKQAEAAAETAAEWMLNKRVEVAADGVVRHKDLPQTD